MMHNLSKWILRVMIVLGAIGFTAVYVNRNGWTVAEAPPIFNGPASAPAPAFVPAYAPVGSATVSFAPCQPIGRTARGELVYSMDCQQVLQGTSGASAVPSTSDDSDKK